MCVRAYVCAFCFRSLFCNVVLSNLPSFANILLSNRERVAFFNCILWLSVFCPLGGSVVCDYGISWSYQLLLFFLYRLTELKPIQNVLT